MTYGQSLVRYIYSTEQVFDRDKIIGGHNQCQDEAVPEEFKSFVHCRLRVLWLWHGDSSGTKEGERTPLEAGTRGLVKIQQTGKNHCVCSKLQTV
jgi:hypothetical protein